MKRSLLLAAILALGPAIGAEATDIEIMHPWVRPSLPDRPAAGYLGIHNNGAEDDRLISARAPGADNVELHTTVEADGVVRMEPLDAIDVPARGMAHLEPGGMHLMIFGLAEPLAEGDELPLTLIFEGAGEVQTVLSVTDEPAHGMHHDGEHDHGHSGAGSGHGSHSGHGNSD